MVIRKSPLPAKQHASPARLSIVKPRRTPTHEPQKACGTCAHLNSTSDDAGECRRYPPQAITKIDGGIADRFPGVRKADIWCGEWKA